MSQIQNLYTYIIHLAFFTIILNFPVWYATSLYHLTIESIYAYRPDSLSGNEPWLDVHDSLDIQKYDSWSSYFLIPVSVFLNKLWDTFNQKQH